MATHTLMGIMVTGGQGTGVMVDGAITVTGVMVDGVIMVIGVRVTGVMGGIGDSILANCDINERKHEEGFH